MFEMSQPIDDKDYYETEIICPNCIDVYLWQQDWYENEELVGHFVKCGNCNFEYGL